MSMNLVNGFSDILPKVNVATNGAFLINQRANFASSTPLVAGDFLVDCWYAGTITADYCEVQAVANDGRLIFTGSGKRSQIIQILSKDTQQLGGLNKYGTTTASRAAITACVSAYNTGSLPIKIQCAPRSKVTALTQLYTSSPIVKAGEYKSAVNALKTQLSGTISTAASFQITLQADGTFQFWVENFSELIGAYRNPPALIPVHYSDDMARCERYYQVGKLPIPMVPLLQAASKMWGYMSVGLRTPMVSTPSISISKNGTNWDVSQLAELGAGSTTEAVSNWTATATSISNKEFLLRLERGSVLSNRSLLNVNASWIAYI